MGKRKRKLTVAEKAEKKRRRELYETVFINGKQKPVRRTTAEGIEIEMDEFIRRNADAIFLHQNEMWECMVQEENEPENGKGADLGDIPF